MELTSETKNQHFVSQADQRLNAVNPEACPENRRIFSFSLADRETHTIVPDHERGRSVAGNLVLYDLFSFDVLNKRTRMNFETLFNQYESRIEENTRSLLGKLARGGGDVK